MSREVQKVPEFLKVPPWPDGDPPSIIYELLDKERAIKLVRAEIAYKQAVLAAQQAFYNSIGEIVKGM
jgi:hypothetical protein